MGGFDADAGVTGRKLVVDNYGPRVPIGGGAFSGKDSSKVDRSAAYMARRIAVDLLENDPETNEVYVYLAYAIGYDKPVQASAIIDGVEVDITPPAIGTVIDGTNSDLTFTGADTNLAANWQGFGDSLSGIPPPTLY